MNRCSARGNGCGLHRFGRRGHVSGFRVARRSGGLWNSLCLGNRSRRGRCGLGRRLRLRRCFGLWRSLRRCLVRVHRNGRGPRRRVVLRCGRDRLRRMILGNGYRRHEKSDDHHRDCRERRRMTPPAAASRSAHRHHCTTSSACIAPVDLMVCRMAMTSAGFRPIALRPLTSESRLLPRTMANLPFS